MAEQLAAVWRGIRTGGKIPSPFSFWKKSPLSLEHLITAMTIGLIFLAWYVVTAHHIFSDVIVPSPARVWAAFLTICSEGYKGTSLLGHFAVSMERLLVAFGLVIITAIPIGLLSGCSTKIRAVFDPIISFYRPLPPLAYYTMLVIWMGIDNSSKITLLYLAGFAPVYLSCLSGVAKVRRDFVRGAQVLGASKYQVFLHVMFPACLPDIFTGLRTALGFSYTTLVAAEMVAAENGIGWMVLDASKFLMSDVIFVGIILMGVTGILMDWALLDLERRIVHWKGKE